MKAGRFLVNADNRRGKAMESELNFDPRLLILLAECTGRIQLEKRSSQRSLNNGCFYHS
jgi:hypothetical protein